jgi:Flp pilus assembly protein TadD/TolB-like protein
VRSVPLFCFFVLAAPVWAADTVAILPFFNQQQARSRNLDWIGESIAENIHEALSSRGLLVLAREEREEVYRRLSVRTAVVLTKATVMKIGESLDAGQVVFGDFSVDGAENGNSTLKSAIRLTAHVINLKRFRETAAITQTGPLETLSQLQTRLAWLVLRELDPTASPNEQEFLQGRPQIRVDAMENYARAMMAMRPEQRTRLLTQAARLDDHFSLPNFQLGKMGFARKEYKSAAPWLTKVMKTDSHYMEANYLLGICRYHEGDFEAAVRLFRTVSAEVPLNEVFNNLGAALSRKGDIAVAEDNFRKALEGDSGDPDYWFNVGYTLWKEGQFGSAADQFRAVLDRTRDDQDATVLLGRCLKREGPRPGEPRSEGRERIKTAFEDSALRQLQAELKGKKTLP